MEKYKKYYLIIMMKGMLTSLRLSNNKIKKNYCKNITLVVETIQQYSNTNYQISTC